jgi:hypothetical protein
MNRTNIGDLLIHLEKNVFKMMFKTQSMRKRSMQIGDSLQKGVLDNIKRGGSVQSSTLHQNLEGQLPEEKSSPSSIKIGFGDIDITGEAKRPSQKASFSLSRHSKTRRLTVFQVNLAPERELPSWVILEFGRKSGVGGASPKGIPKNFLVSYTPRDQQKNMLIGPSLTSHSKKPVFFMGTTRKDGYKSNIAKSKLDARPHPGIRARKIFRDSLKTRKDIINVLFSMGIRESLRELGNRH